MATLEQCQEELQATRSALQATKSRLSDREQELAGARKDVEASGRAASELEARIDELQAENGELSDHLQEAEAKLRERARQVEQHSAPDASHLVPESLAPIRVQPQERLGGSAPGLDGAGDQSAHAIIVASAEAARREARTCQQLLEQSRARVKDLEEELLQARTANALQRSQSFTMRTQLEGLAREDERQKDKTQSCGRLEVQQKTVVAAVLPTD